jgi:hypothetical protein
MRNYLLVSSKCLVVVGLLRLTGGCTAWTHASPFWEPMAQENRHFSTLLLEPYIQLKARFLSILTSNLPNIPSTLPINYRMNAPLLNISNSSSSRDSRIRIFRCIFSPTPCVWTLTSSQAWRAQLGRFGLSGSHQTSPIRHLSDGLRNR